MDIPSESLYRLVKDLMVEQLRVRPDQVELDTTIEDDLGTTGDDAMELMGAFMYRFKVDMTDYDHQKHFDQEASGCFFLWWGWGQAREFQPVTVEHLVRVAQGGHWFNPPRLSNDSKG
ncbi:MAG: DUF1493 family protein [Armatimonadetes bacterium]|nr:DUF1493 family protein [Armatimonadota bacterium]